MLNKLKVLFKNETGSTSVLIVVMMIVLTAFGMAALTTAYAGYRLSGKTVVFSQEYYALEAKAAEMEYEIIELVSQHLDGIGNSEALFDDLLDYAKNHEEISIEGDSSTLVDGIVHVNLIVKEEGKQGKYIGVKLNVFMPQRGDNASDLVNVVQRYEWQEGIGGVSEDIFFEDPFEELDGDEESTEEDTNPFDDLDQSEEDNNPFDDLDDDFDENDE